MPGADDAKNTAMDLAGKAKEVAGRITDDEDLEIVGAIEGAAATAGKNDEHEHDLFG